MVGIGLKSVGCSPRCTHVQLEAGILLGVLRKFAQALERVIHAQVLRARVFVAQHMHAGDGRQAGVLHPRAPRQPALLAAQQDPCHTRMKTHAPLKVVNQLMGQKVELSDRCCGESGTLAASRPDVSTQVRLRKEEEIVKVADRLRGDAFRGELRILTSCPSCLQGLSRYGADTATSADYIVVEMAQRLLGPNWLEQYVAKANAGGIERVLL
jgi:Fe-S oxidoreductase